jgi:Tfp pilus assembly protein PilZ
MKVAFPRIEVFEREYATNLANGGVFVATAEPFALRERVRVKLVLGFCRRALEFDGEVVHIVTAEMAEMGGTRGVAVQFDVPAAVVRERLAPMLGEAEDPGRRAVDAGRRTAPRSQARVAATIDGSGERIAGHTRNLSQSGVLVTVPGQGPPVGERVRLTLEHPTSGERMQLEGTVAREVETSGGVTALGIRFDPAPGQRAEAESFVEGIRSVEHTRRLGGIAGDVAELGVSGLIQMFGTTAPAGTLTLRRGEEEGVVGFEGGLLRYARLGPASGIKALTRLLAWSDGRFEFHAHLDPVERAEAPLPLDAALLDASIALDEQSRSGTSPIPLDAMPRPVADFDEGGEELSKVEQAVLDLARAGFTVQRMMDVIPEPDSAILQAVASLIESRAIVV